METKKSDKANLEQHRREYFLMGLIFALALLFTALEYTTRPQSAADDSDLSDDMTEEMDMKPAMDMKDMISAAPAPASKSITDNVKAGGSGLCRSSDDVSKSITDNVKAVAHTSNSTDQIAPVTSKLLIGNGQGVAKDANVTEALPQITTDKDSLEEKTLEQLPEFPGGIVEFMKWLTRNLHYPPLARQQKIEGKVVVSFIINTDGSIASPKVQKSASPMLDAEALRVIKMMPRWKPGIMKGKPCKTMFAIPVNFVI